MTLTRQLTRWGTAGLARRLGRAMPLIGGAIAVVAIAQQIRRKGFVGGTLDTLLNATPYVGAVKNFAEMARGRDYIPDRPPMAGLTASAKAPAVRRSFSEGGSFMRRRKPGATGSTEKPPMATTGSTESHSSYRETRVAAPHRVAPTFRSAVVPRLPTGPQTRPRTPNP